MQRTAGGTAALTCVEDGVIGAVIADVMHDQQAVQALFQGMVLLKEGLQVRFRRVPHLPQPLTALMPQPQGSLLPHLRLKT